MRIGIISTPFVAVPPRDYGGTELVVYELAEGLRERGHDILLFATGDSRTGARLRSYYPQAQWPPDVMTDLNHVSWAFARAMEEGVELIHAHSAAALAFARAYPDVPLVYTLHHERDEILSAFYRHFPDPWYVAISADQARREVRLPRLEVIHHGLDPSWYRVAPEPSDYLCFVGRFAPVKGVHTAIDVAERAGRPIRVAGSIHEVDQAYGEREVLPRLTRPHVSHLGCIGMEVKVPLLAGARALLAPIEWHEPFGLVLVEAMMSGCPVVSHPRGSLPELVEEGVTGFLVEDADEMVELVRPGGRLDGFDRTACRERAIERFSRERMVRDHEALYRRILGGAGTARSSLVEVA